MTLPRSTSLANCPEIPQSTIIPEAPTPSPRSQRPPRRRSQRPPEGPALYDHLKDLLSATTGKETPEVMDNAVKAQFWNDGHSASVNVALQPDTQFYVYPGCFEPYAEMDKCKLVSLGQGGFLIFRGDLVHAGAEFDEENLRQHCYVRVRGIRRRYDATEAAVFNRYLCTHCAISCTSKRHLANHRHYCTENPDKVKAKRARIEAYARGGHCDKCNKVFEKRSALHQHNHRRHPKKPKKKSNFNEELAFVYQKDMVDDDRGSGEDSDYYIESDSSVDAASSDGDEEASEAGRDEKEGKGEIKEESEYEIEEESEEALQAIQI